MRSTASRPRSLDCVICLLSLRSAFNHAEEARPGTSVFVNHTEADEVCFALGLDAGDSANDVESAHTRDVDLALFTTGHVVTAHEPCLNRLEGFAIIL